MRNRFKAITTTLVVAVTLGSLAACSAGSGSTAAPTAGAASLGKITVGTSGGLYTQLQQQYTIPVLNKLSNAPQVSYISNDQAPRDTMMRAEGASKKGTLDVYQGDVTLQAMADEGLLEKLDTSKIPNLKYVPAAERNEYWIPQMQSVSTIVYNKKKISSPPNSYEDLFGSKYAGKVGVFPNQWIDWFHAASTASQGKDATGGFDAGIPVLEKLGKTVQVLPDQNGLGQALQSGQIWLTLDWAAKPYLWNQQAGNNDIGVAVPKEGTFAIVFGMGIPKNAPNKAGAYAYLNAMLDPSVQRAYAAKMGYSPTVTNAALPSDLSLYKLTSAEKKLVKPLNLSYVASNTARWYDTWQKDVVNH
jgi:putative spermidine/putrescine transport system substrate-binding protein